MSRTTRRTFVVQSAALLPVARSLMKGESLRASNLGVQLYTVRNVIEKDPAATLKAIQEIGFAEVEAIYASLDKIWSGLKETSLQPVSVHVDTHILTGDAGKLTSVLDDVKQRGFKYVVVPYIMPSERGGADMFKTLADKLNSAGEKAKSNGLTLCYHNHAFEFQPIGGSTGLEILMKQTHEEFVSLEMDVFWVSVAGHDPVELLKKYKGRVALLHLKDKAAGFTKAQFNEDVPKDTFKEVGSGSIHFDDVLKAADQAGVQNYFVEQDQTPGDPIASLRKSYQFLQQKFS